MSSKEASEPTSEPHGSASETSDEVPARPRVRLQRFLAACGLGSRRACEELIAAERVSVDGELVTVMGVTVDPGTQRIALDGEPLRMERKKYYALNKPPGVVCSNRDPAGRPRIVDLFPLDSPRLFTVGRLDEGSEGLILVTNDGDLAQKLAHPKYRIYRTYHVQVAGHPKPAVLDSLCEGLYFADGKFRVQSAKFLKKQGKSSHLEIVLTEGHNREVRRLLARVGHKVMKLTRVAFGPLHLGKLPRGKFRELTRDELGRLLTVIHRNTSEGGGEPARPKRPARRKGPPPRGRRAASGEPRKRRSEKSTPKAAVHRRK